MHYVKFIIMVIISIDKLEYIYLIYGQVQIRIQIVGARIYQAVIPKVLKIPD